jgi:hypothetical protein
MPTVVFAEEDFPNEKEKQTVFVSSSNRDAVHSGCRDFDDGERNRNDARMG